MSKKNVMADLFIPPSKIRKTDKELARQDAAMMMFCGAAFASACMERLATETPEERKKREETARKAAEERATREEEFKRRNRVRQVERMCGNCKHGENMLDDGCYWCTHPSLAGDSLLASEGMVCDAWEADT